MNPDHSQYTIRPAEPNEVLVAARLICADDENSAQAERSGRFLLDYLRAQKLDLTWGVLIEQSGRSISACGCVESPGSCATLLLPHGPMEHVDAPAIRQAIDYLVGQCKLRGVKVLQCLTGPGDARQGVALTSAGFKSVADLQYMTLEMSNTDTRKAFTSSLTFVPYQSVSKSVFEEILRQTYLQSLDFPELTGIRSVEEMILSHQFTGEHDPNLWYVVCDPHNEPVGVLLLTRVPMQSQLEIVYVGVGAQHRGCGYGKQIVEFAVETARRRGVNGMMLAVDTRNRYAVRIYETAGFVSSSIRQVWVRVFVTT